MRIIDLTHRITEDMPVYPGTDQPKLEATSTCARDGFAETRLTLFSHTGTHIDAPAHIYPAGTTLDAFPAAQFVGKALVVDCTAMPAGGSIGMELIDRALADRADFLLLRTGWDACWGKPEYFASYPILSHELADYLLTSGKKGVGLDTIGVDTIEDENLTFHKKLLSKQDFIILENLRGLDRCGSGLFTLCALPMPYDHADGAPARIIAMLED